METRKKSTAKMPETGEAVAKGKALNKAWLRAVEHEKEMREKETREMSQEKVVPRASRQDGDEEVNYDSKEASEHPEEDQVGDSQRIKRWSSLS